MPFDKKSNVELQFLKSAFNKTNEIPLHVTIYYNDTKRTSDEGKFYASWKREINPEIGKPYQILHKTGRGHYVATLLQAQGLNSGMTLFFEGDDECWVDGEMRLHGTGSEDYFNGGWYALADRWDQAYSLPVHGCLAYSIPLANTGAYRLLLTDKISFEKDFQLSIEHGPEGNKIPVDYTSVALYYCDTPPEKNNLPSMELLENVPSPKMQEYWIQLLPVRSMSEGAGVSNGFCKDERTGKNINVMKIEAPDDGFTKFELEVPSNGEYKLYLSYFKGPELSAFQINQRQVPISEMLDAHASENSLIEKQLIGTMLIREGTNTITMVLKNNTDKNAINKFFLQSIYLERITSNKNY
jgi:hypothetical protein